MSQRQKLREKYDHQKPKKEAEIKVPTGPRNDVKLEVEYLAIDLLNPATYNPREISNAELSRLVNNINTFGFIDPIIRNTYPGRENIVCGGHQRLRAARILGMPAVPVVSVHVPEKQEKALNISLNRIGGDFVLDKLTDLLQELYDTEFDMELTGFDDQEIKILLGIHDATERTDPDDVPEPKEIVAETGDVWICGSHRLKCGDSTKQEDVDDLMAGQLCDMIWTDPPYNVNYTDNHNTTVQRIKKMPGSSLEGRKGTAVKKDIINDKHTAEDFSSLIHSAFATAANVTKAGGCIYVAHADGVNSEGDNIGLIFRKMFMSAGFDLKQILVWVKNNHTLCRQDYNYRHESILYGWKPGAAHFFNQDFSQTTVIDDEADLKKLDKQALLDMVKELRQRIPETVIRCDMPHVSELHPTTKPVRLVEIMMINSSQEGEIVLDLFGGSGTTMIAAEKNGRRARLMEIDPHYCTVILERIWGYSRTEPQLETKDGRLIPFTEVKRLRQEQQ